MVYRCPMWPLGLLFWLSAYLMFRSGLRLWRDPSRLKPDSYRYTIIVAWLRVPRLDLWGKLQQPIVLDPYQIRFVAMMDVISAVLMFVLGVIALSLDWLPR